MAEPTRMTVNRAPQTLVVDPERSLLSVLRDELGLLGARMSCGEGECGACTVLLDGTPVRSCVTPVREAAGRSVTTVEGLSAGGQLHPVARAFLEEGAVQCGFCTSGMIVSAAALLARDPHPDEAAIREALEGNICRCGTYPRILRAVSRAAALASGADGATGPEPDGQADHTGENGTTVPAVRTALPTAEASLPRPPAPWDLLPPEERDYFGMLGDGLVVVLPPSEAARNHPDQPGPWHANGGAWLHVGATGVTTAFTGKVDFGQHNRRALALLVAAELGVPVDSVRLVMGDTDVCPYDVGTFGSRSITDVGQYLRATAIRARQLLVEAAAGHPGLGDGALEIRDGRIGALSGGRTVGLPELLTGVRRVAQADMALATSGEPRPVEQHHAPGAGAVDGVTGRRRYVSDLVRPGMLHGKVLRPPSFGATLRSVDLSAARGMPGVTVVQDGSFVGVTAPSLPGATRALASIRAEWDEVPQPSEAAIEDYLRSHPSAGHGWEGPVRQETGDVERALATAEIRLDATYTAAYIAHVPLETRAALAEWDGDRLTVWTGTQRPFGVREQLAGALGIPQERIRVVVPATGGGWGGKHSGDAAVEAARLARAVGRPVRVRWGREEETTWAYFRPYAIMDVRSGAARDGSLWAWEFRNLHAGPNALDTPYEVANRRVEFQPTAAPLRTGSYRALAATANNFARESHMDELAHALGVDPLEFRLRNLRDDRLATVLRAAAERAGWGRRAEPGRGLGIAGGIEKWARIATVADVRVRADGHVDLQGIVSAYECGRVVDRDGLLNQVEGATVMGLGAALFEAVHFEQGRILNPKLSQYRVPRFSDVPPIEVVLIDRPDLEPAGGGEVPIIAVAPAIANAIFAATGRRVRSMPLVPDGVVR